MTVTLSLITIIILLGASGFFAGSETALTAVSKARMHLLAQEGRRGARSVNAAIADRERLISSLLLGNTFVNILASSLATSLALRYFTEFGVVAATFIMTTVILIFGEVLPKTLAIARTDRMALALATPARIVIAVFGPIVSTVQFIVWRVLNLLGVSQTQAESSVTAHEEIRGAIDLHHQEGGVEREHRDMLGGILNLRELKVADAMVHRKNMVIVDADSPGGEIVESMLSSGHTRFPIYRGAPENIVGVLHIKDLLLKMAKLRGLIEGLDVLALAVEPWFVPDTTTLDEQVHAFRDRRAHFALVVDEYGTLQGLITLEDILEEIFGHFAEAHDSDVPEGIRAQADGSYIVDGWTPIRAINRELDWNLPDDEATTVAGLVIRQAHLIPDAGQKFSFFGFKFEILRRQRNQIVAIRITPPRQLRAAASATAS